jgi:dTDP-4-dehydrorhamnose reductase
LDTEKLQRDFNVQLPDWKEGMRHVLAELRRLAIQR